MTTNLKQKELLKVFETLDNDKSGYIELAEFLYGIKFIYGIEDNSCDALIHDIFNYVDGTGLFNSRDHKLNRNELKKIWSKIPKDLVVGKKGILDLFFEVIEQKTNNVIEPISFKKKIQKQGVNTFISTEIKSLYSSITDMSSVITKEMFLAL